MYAILTFHMDESGRKSPSTYLGLSFGFLTFLWLVLLLITFATDSTDSFTRTLEFIIFFSVFRVSTYYIIPAFTVVFLVLTIFPILLNRKISNILHVSELIIFATNILLLVLFLCHFSYPFIRGTSIECRVQPWLPKHSCYEELARKSNNINFCKEGEERCFSSSNGFTPELKLCERELASCLTYFALKENNQSLCPKSKTGCITALAEQLAQPKICEEIDPSDQEESRVCYATLARDLKDYSLCEKYVPKKTDYNRYHDYNYVIGGRPHHTADETCYILREDLNPSDTR